MNKEEYIATAEESLFHVYNRFPVVFEKGNGVHIYDTDGKEYLDFASGIGVMHLVTMTANTNRHSWIRSTRLPIPPTSTIIRQ